VNVVKPEPGSLMEQVIVTGDLSKLTPEQRVSYYHQVTESLGLNPYTRPFDYIVLNGRLTLYTKKDATDQLRKLHGVSITQLDHSMIGKTYVVTAYAKDRDGRIDSAVGAVYVGNLEGEPLANAIMRCETKAKRRLTLSICGLGMTDESEVDSIPDARVVQVDPDTGEIGAGSGLPAPQAGTHPPAQPSLPDTVTSADEAIWKRYVEVLAEAQGLGIKTQPARLPISRMQLTSLGLTLREAIRHRQNELADADAERASVAEPEPESGSPETEAWRRNRDLSAQAARLKIRVPVLRNNTPLAEVEQANEEIAARIEHETMRRMQVDQHQQSF
jgi:hypothetical protein